MLLSRGLEVCTGENAVCDALYAHPVTESHVLTRKDCISKVWWSLRESCNSKLQHHALGDSVDAAIASTHVLSSARQPDSHTLDCHRQEPAGTPVC